jgi:hypothetical protein
VPKTKHVEDTITMPKTDLRQTGATDPTLGAISPGAKRPASALLFLASLIAVLTLAIFQFATAADASTLWSSSAVPAIPDTGDYHSVELGVRFQADTAGYIVGIRFYKAPTNTGTHVGHLWSNSGTLLASVVFSGETPSGWQEATLSSPVAIAANTSYIVSYLAPNGHYSLNRPYFGGAYNNSPLHALADSSGQPNGIYYYPAAGFPQSTYQQSNYWVDVDFTSTGSGSGLTPSVSSISPSNGPTTGGTAVTINGSNFQSGANVSFGGANSTAVTFISASQLNALSPAGSGTVSIAVTNTGGASGSLSGAFTYTASSGGGGGSSGSGGGVSSGQGLLTGMTASSYTTPSGWTLVEAVGFEDGTRGPGASSSNMAIECGFAHSGNCAFRGAYDTGDKTVSWSSQALGNSRDTYVSFWEYDEPQGRMNADFDIGGVQAFGYTDAMIRFQPGCGGNALSNALGIPYAWNAVLERPTLYAEGNGSNPNFATWGWGNECLAPNVLSDGSQGWGNWTQWEIRVKENDPTNPSSPANGEVELYQNGKLVNYISQYQGQCSSNPVPCSNLAGNLDIASLYHVAVVGGVYTKYVEYQDSGLTVCEIYPNLPSYGRIMGSFSNPDPCPVQAPPSGYVPTFNRYFDDIIVLKR